MPSPRNLVFPADAQPQDAVQRVQGALRTLDAAGLGVFAPPMYERLSDALDLYTWSRSDEGGVSVNLTINWQTSTTFVTVVEPVDNAVVGAALARRLGLPTAKELTAVAARSRGDGSALERAALASGPQEESELDRIVRGALQDDDASVRKAATRSCALLRWPTLAGPLLEALSTEPEEDIKRLIRIALSKCQSRYGGVGDPRDALS